jgi:hypothetical protein
MCACRPVAKSLSLRLEGALQRARRCRVTAPGRRRPSASGSSGRPLMEGPRNWARPAGTKRNRRIVLRPAVLGTRRRCLRLLTCVCVCCQFFPSVGPAHERAPFTLEQCKKLSTMTKAIDDEQQHHHRRRRRDEHTQNLSNIRLCARRLCRPARHLSDAPVLVDASGR